MNLLFVLLLSCISVDMSGKLKHEHNVDVKIRIMDDTGDSGGPLEPKQVFK